MQRKVYGPYTVKETVHTNYPLGSERLDFLNREFKSVVLTMFTDLKGTMSEELKSLSPQIAPLLLGIMS